MSDDPPPLTFLKRLRNRIIWSWAGVRDAWMNEYSFRAWVWTNLISDAVAIALPIGETERMAIMVLGILVLAVELVNTGLERLTDLVTSDLEDLAGRAKDAGSAAVAVTAVAAGLAWLFALANM